DQRHAAPRQDGPDAFVGGFGKSPRRPERSEGQLIDEVMRDAFTFPERRLRRTDVELPVDLTTVEGDDLGTQALGNLEAQFGLPDGRRSGQEEERAGAVVAQYLGVEGSISSLQARIPPLRFTAFVKPRSRRSATACAERAPERQ